MSRRRNGSLLESIFELLLYAPWWVGPSLAVIIWGFLSFILLSMTPQKSGEIETGRILIPLFRALAIWFPIAVLFLWLVAEIRKWSHRRMFDRQTGLGSIRQLDWQNFEHLVSEAYRRRGYIAQTTGSNGNDGGVDIILTGNGETILVQCKHWKAWRVHVPVIRELCGVVADRKATRGIVVTSGRFTREAIAFAQRNRIELVSGPQLAQLIKQVQTHSVPMQKHQSPQPSSPPVCPVCNSPMVQRTARHGAHAGSDFWGCSRYPACRGTRQITH